jgi:carboxyl-terminal processing protease
VERIRGGPGCYVSLNIERPVSGEPLRYDLMLQSIALDSIVDIEMKAGAVGYFRVRQFIENTDSEMRTALENLQNQGMRGLILDLRGNPGGRLDTAARMAEVFLQRGQRILTVQSRRGVQDIFEVGAEDSASYSGPLIVLIDGGSASASEILAGALRDHSRAILVGERSFGKGSVQSVVSFRGGDGLKLTSARYLLPSGEAINGKGVSPDVQVEMAPRESLLRMLQKHHLRKMSAESFKEAFGFAPRKDVQLKTAENLIGGILAGGCLPLSERLYRLSPLTAGGVPKMPV